MSFALPGAFWALTSILLLILFSLWRLRPGRVSVPSLALWRKLPATVPPVRALRKPRWSVALLLQAAAVAAIVTALAAPFLLDSKPARRKIAVIVDLGARARLDRLRLELAAIKDATSHDDAIMIEVPSLKRGPVTTSVEKVDYVGDPAIAMNAARAEGRRVIWVGDRATAADGIVLTGAPSDNVGITDLAVDADGAFVRLLNLGAERELVVRINEASEKWLVKAGESTRLLPLPAQRLEIELPMDDFPLDNRAVAVRGGAVTVEFRGDPSQTLRRAVEVQPSAHIVDKGGSFIVALGLKPEGDGVFVDPPGGDPVAVKAFSMADHPLAKAMRAEQLKLAAVRPLPGGYVPVAYADGAPVIGVKGRTIVVSASLGEWPQTPSFPIFFKNVMDWARAGVPLWSVAKTGPSQPRATGDVGVLDVDASSLGRERKPFDPAMLGSAEPEPVGRDVTIWAVIAAAALALVSWISESKAERRG